MFDRFFRKKETGARGETIPARHDGFPDTSTLSGSCPRCKTQSSFETAGAIPVTFSDMSTVGRDGSMVRVPYDRVAVLVCRHCQQGIAVVEEQMTGEYPSASSKGAVNSGGAASIGGPFLGVSAIRQYRRKSKTRSTRHAGRSPPTVRVPAQ
jgi:hypothetical protein